MNKPPNFAKLNPILHNLAQVKTEEFKRPDHPDFFTSAELKTSKYSGMRDNRIAMCYEIWVVGEMVKNVSYADVVKDQFAVTKAIREYFAFKEIPK